MTRVLSACDPASEDAWRTAIVTRSVLPGTPSFASRAVRVETLSGPWDLAALANSLVME